MEITKQKIERWVVWIQCKGYTKKYLLSNFNSADDDWPEIVNLASDKVLHRSFINHLTRSNHQRDKRISNKRYPVTVPIEINKNIFNRYGWELTDTEQVEFNAEVEQRVKLILHTYVSMMSITGMSIKECIRRFRLATGINEFDWDEDSIRKEISRHCKVNGKEEFEQICKNITKKVCAILSENGLITKQGEDEYENN